MILAYYATLHFLQEVVSRDKLRKNSHHVICLTGTWRNGTLVMSKLAKDDEPTLVLHAGL